jgi:hypothetical protein
MSVISFARIDGLYTDQQRRVARVINDIFPSVRLIRMEPGHPQFDPQKPFALVDEPNLAPPYHIRNMAESEIDHRLIAWLAENNRKDPNSKVNKLDLLQKAHALLEEKKFADYQAEKQDMLKSMMKSNKHEYRHNGKVLRK